MKSIRIATMLLLAIAVVSVGFTACSNSNATKPSTPVHKVMDTPVTKAKPDVKALEDIGFGNSSSIVALKTDALKDVYARKGMTFISQEEIMTFMTANDFIIGPSERYTGTITEDAATAILQNYGMVKKDAGEVKYEIAPGNWRTAEQINKTFTADFAAGLIKSSPKNIGIFVVGPASKFNTEGMEITDHQLKSKNHDPLAVCKVDGGWVELARW